MVDGVSIPLALEDAVPVALSTAGFVLLARGVRDRVGEATGRAALVAAVLIASGGVAKVSWKLIAAFAGEDVTWLDDLLFPLLALGFSGFVVALLAARRDRAASGAVWIAIAIAGAVVAAAVATLGEAGLRVALAVAVVGSLTASGLLIRIALAAGEGRSAAFLAVNVTATLVLAGLARIEDQTLALQWVEQTTNTVSQALFLAAAARLARGTTSWTQPDPHAVPVPL